MRKNDYTKYMPPLASPLEAVQLTNDGSLSNNAAVQDERPVTLADRLGNRLSMAGSRIADALLGKQAAPTDSIDVDNMSAGISANPRVGGLLNDISSGYRENYNNRFNVNNLLPNEDKTWGTRLGEGLGTLGRFVDSPLGRFTLAAGLNSALGYKNSLQEGLTAGVGRQNAQTADELYRNAMIEQAQNSLRNRPEFNSLSNEEKQAIINQMIANKQIKDINNLTDIEKQILQNAFNEQLRFNQQSQLEDVANRIKNIRGNINSDIFRQILFGQQLQDNAAYRQLYLDNQQRQNEIMNQLRKDQLRRQERQDAQDNYYKGQQVAQGWAKINNDRNKPASFSEVASLRKEYSSLPPVKNDTVITRQYNNVTSLYNQYKAGKIGKNAFDQALITTLNKVLDPTSVVRESEFDRTAAGQAMWDKLSGYSQKLAKGGSGLTDANRADLVNALTTMKNANDKEVQIITSDYADLAKRYGINPADIMPRHYKKTNNSSISEGTYRDLYL